MERTATMCKSHKRPRIAGRYGVMTGGASLKGYACLRSRRCLSTTVLMSACREMPRFLASLSRAATIQSGKSTLTLFFWRLGCRTAERSRKGVMSSPSSKRRSNSSVEICSCIQRLLLFACSSYGDDPGRLVHVGDDGSPTAVCHVADDKPAWFFSMGAGNLNQLRVVPQGRCFFEVNAMFDSVACALRGGVLENHMKIICKQW
ncbi:hypothetical protein DVU_1640 [Nitratidesulfovibrio vulgaris str. Hildenborough]|uniref:Uncharacterized protein n=1 Tax=Nitratidesulfovibrio vulgaris (strain ATCC 29579 / DSM 644 / CCUG 34227 / NCIMB 8303 / VKM B-1760 / Hildenborough) TaxID=882 RepID=Q72BJ5_NITV2|nr:hypothetical protein DVU_1640 [Nitratidesulfovibrio vulgaris str. Hildenborough]